MAGVSRNGAKAQRVSLFGFGSFIEILCRCAVARYKKFNQRHKTALLSLCLRHKTSKNP